MSETYTADKLNTMSVSELSQIILSQQEQIMKLNENFERLVEQLRIANQQRFGRHSEKLDVIDGQYSLFNEAEVWADPGAEEPPVEEVVASYNRKKQKGKLDDDLKEINKSMNDLEATWKSDAATDIRAAMNALKPRFEEHKTVVESYAKFLVTTAQNYETTEGTIQGNASAFK